MRSDKGSSDDTSDVDVNTAYLQQDRKRRLTRRRRISQAFRLGKRRFIKVVYAPVASLLAKTNICFLHISNPNRIGHLAAELDWYLKKVELGDFPRYRAVLLLSRDRAANPALLDLWARHLVLVEHPVLRWLLRPLTFFPSITLDLGQSVAMVQGSTDYPSVLERWGGRAPLVSLSQEMERSGMAALEDLGLPKDAWYVAVHAREGGYSPKDEYIHGHRNSAIDAVVLAAEEIARRGGWCIRMGDASMSPMPPTPNVIDYATSRFKSDWMDVFLCANTRFFLGNTSGLCLVSALFQVPSVLVNMIPIGACFGMGPDDISIPKTILDENGTRLSFAEIMGSEIADYRMHELYEQRGLSVVENTPEEVRDVTIEMLDRLDGKWVETPEDRILQQRFRALMQPHHYCYQTRSKLGAMYLRQNQEALG